MLDDFLHLVDGQCDALVVGSLQPQGNDACCDGRCHRRTVGFHPSVASWGGLTFKLIREILVGNDVVEFIVHERVAGTIDTVTGCYHEGMLVTGIVNAIAGVSGYIAYRFLCISCWLFTWFANNQRDTSGAEVAYADIGRSLVKSLGVLKLAAAIGVDPCALLYALVSRHLDT